MDVFSSLPGEIRKQILNSLDSRDDVLRICVESTSMYRAAGSLYKQYLESEIGTDIIFQVFIDAVAVVTFPVIDHSTSRESQKAVIMNHLRQWQNGGLAERVTSDVNLKACSLIDKVIKPLLEDYAEKSKDLDVVHDQLRLPPFHPDAPNFRLDLLESYHPEERLRLLRGFLRFEILMNVVKARPGPQLFSMVEQMEILNTLFDAWEVEEVLCVQQYVFDMHHLLLKNRTAKTFAKVYYQATKHAQLRGEVQAQGEEELVQGIDDHTVRICMTPAEDGNNQSNGTQGNGSQDNVTQDNGRSQTPFSIEKLGDHDDAAVPVRNLLFIDAKTQTTFIKQLATFGLRFLHALLSGKVRYANWLHHYSETILNGIATPEEAAYFGTNPSDYWMSAPARPDHLNYREKQFRDRIRAGVRNPKISAGIYFGRYPGKGEDGANTAWRFLKFARHERKESYRRCGWVFWCDERLQTRRFWNYRLRALPEHGDSGEPAPAWFTAIPAEDWSIEVWDQWKMDNEAGHHVDLKSVADLKQFRFWIETQIGLLARFFKEGGHQMSGLEGLKVFQDEWDVLVPSPAPAASGSVRVFQGIVWG